MEMKKSEQRNKMAKSRPAVSGAGKNLVLIFVTVTAMFTAGCASPPYHTDPAAAESGPSESVSESSLAGAVSESSPAGAVSESSLAGAASESSLAGTVSESGPTGSASESNGTEPGEPGKKEADIFRIEAEKIRKETADEFRKEAERIRKEIMESREEAKTEPEERREVIKADSVQPGEPFHEHDWVPVTVTVHHDAVTHTVRHDAITRTIHHDAAFHEEPIYELRTICNTCGEDITGHIEEHTGLVCGGSYNELQIQTGVNIVTDNEAYDEEVIEKEAWDERIIDRAAYDDIITTGYRCSICGEEKGLPDDAAVPFQ